MSKIFTQTKTNFHILQLNKEWRKCRLGILAQHGDSLKILAPILTFPHRGRKCAFTLAEGATHVAMPNKKRSFGFTLAEVLITLGIIGVVAAITMPTLIQNHQKQVYVNQLKKTYSTLEQGFQKMLAEEGVESLCDLPYWPENDYVMYGQGSSDVISFIDNVLSKGFKVTYNNVKEDGYHDQAQFADNSAIIAGRIYACNENSGNAWSPKSTAECEVIKSLGGNMCSKLGERIIIDVNGAKGPNRRGRDQFIFYLSENGKLYPEGGKDSALYDQQTELASNSSYWKNNDNCLEEGNNCAARVIENGWKMDY